MKEYFTRKKKKDMKTIEYVDTDSVIMELKVGEGREYAEKMFKLWKAYREYLEEEKENKKNGKR